MIFNGNHLDLSSGGCPAKCMSVNPAARMLIRDGKVDEGIPNRTETAVRAYDPCVSCASHRPDDDNGISITITNAKDEVVTEWPPRP